MKTKLLFTFLFCGFLIQAQHKKASNKHPKSIYTLNLENDQNGNFAVNNRLHITGFSFVFVKDEDMENGNFSVAFKDVFKKPSSFIYDDYNSFYNNNFLKGFLRKYDPTRWEPREIISQ